MVKGYQNAVISNKDLNINLIEKKYTKGIQELIHRFRRPYPSDMDYIRRLDKEYDIIEKKGFVNTFHRVCDLLDLIKEKNKKPFGCNKLYHLPVEPNPPLPRSVSSNSSTTSILIGFKDGWTN